MKLLTFSLLSLAIVSCGKSSPQRNSSLSQMVAPVMGNNPIFLTKQVEACGSSVFSDYRFDLSLFLEGRAEKKNKDLTGLIQDNYVRDTNQRSVTRSTYGEKQLILINAENGLQKSAFYQVDPIVGTDVTICPDQKSYERSSIESATLNVTHYIDKVYQKVTTLMPTLFIAPVNLRIGSEYRFTILNQRAQGMEHKIEYWVDNAFYEPGKDTITFLPHDSKNRHKNDPNFWEIPMIAAHEYGHHIFHSLAPQSKTSTMVRGCFHNAFKSAPKHHLLGTDAIVEVANEDVETSLNEGFADLIANYTLTSDESSLDQVRGLMINRDMKYSFMMIDGFRMVEKKFLDSTLSQFFALRSDTAPKTPFQDVHVIGAIFAYRADQFFNSLSLNKEQKLKAILEWASQYGKERSSMTGLKPRAYLEKMLQLLVRTTYKSQNKTITPEECKPITEFYPIFAKTIQECASSEI